MNGRERVLGMLVKAQSDGAYSNLLLDSSLAGNNEDRAFVTALFYGVTERRMTLDHIIRTYSNTEFDDIENETLQLLRMGIYQLMYMDIPDSAAVNETVKLAPQRSKGYVNAVLRAFIRDGKRLDTDGLDELGKLSVTYSCAKWIVKMWAKDYGIEKTENMLRSSFGRPPVYARVNTIVCDADDLIYELAEDGVKAERYHDSDTCVVMLDAVGIEKLRAYRNGLFHIQDISSQTCCEAASPREGDTVIDMCAAPGGKSFTLAELMNNNGTVYSSDLYESRVKLIEQGAGRLGLDIVRARVSDASVFDVKLPQADVVLCDVPCSGLGVIRRKPEIKYKKKDELAGLPVIQKKILENAANYVRPGGRLVYSTCTLNKAENENIADQFAAEHTGFDLIDAKTFFPETDGGDGFFFAVFEKRQK